MGSRPTTENIPIDSVHRVFSRTLQSARYTVLGSIWIPELERDGVDTDPDVLKHNKEALAKGNELLDMLGIARKVDFEITEVV